jgi:hypothetical protein
MVTRGNAMTRAEEINKDKKETDGKKKLKPIQ